MAQIPVRRPDPANNGLDPDSFFRYLWFFFKICCLLPLKERCKAKAKANAKAKSNSQLGPDFSLPRCASLVKAYFLSFYLNNWPATFFLFPMLAKAAKQYWLRHHVLDPQSYLVVTQSGSGSSDEPRSCTGLMPFNLALDPDLGPDPNPGSAISAVPDSVWTWGG